jgi:hypothetical protein
LCIAAGIVIVLTNGTAQAAKMPSMIARPMKFAG